MDNIDPDTHEQEFFANLLSDSELDDSVCEEYQAKLRSQVLDTFDRSCDPHRLSGPAVEKSVTTLHWNSRNSLLAIASIAACLICVAAFWSADLDILNRTVVVQPQPVSMEDIDPLLLAAIADVDAWQGTVPADAFFNALAQCEIQLETRRQANTANEMRWLYESLISNPKTPKG